MKKLVISLLIVTLALTSAFASGAAETAGSVSTDGSTSMEKVIGSLGEAFMSNNKGVNFTYNPTGSSSGIQAVSEGRCDIGLSSRALKDSEIAKGLKGTVLAIDGIAIVVNPNNGVSDLSLTQLSDIFTGKITNWKELGGIDSQIVVIGREAGSGTRDGFESITKTSDKCVYRQELTSTGDVIATVASNENAIGYASLSSVKSNVKAVSVDGVAPSEDTIKDGSYRVQRPFVMVTVENKALSATAQNFFDWSLSSEAAPIISKAGAIPLV